MLIPPKKFRPFIVVPFLALVIGMIISLNASREFSASDFEKILKAHEWCSPPVNIYTFEEDGFYKSRIDDMSFAIYTEKIGEWEISTNESGHVILQLEYMSSNGFHGMYPAKFTRHGDLEFKDGSKEIVFEKCGEVDI